MPKGSANFDMLMLSLPVASAQFTNLDRDNDDFLSKSEIEAAGGKWSGLALYDLNSTYTFKPQVRIRKIAIILK